MAKEIYLGEEWQLSNKKGKRHPYGGERVSDRIDFFSKVSAYEKRLSRLERESKQKDRKIYKEKTIQIHGFLKGEVSVKGISLILK
jgi:hypothetical protein